MARKPLIECELSTVDSWPTATKRKKIQIYRPLTLVFRSRIDVSDTPRSTLSHTPYNLYFNILDSLGTRSFGHLFRSFHYAAIAYQLHFSVDMDKLRNY